MNCLCSVTKALCFTVLICFPWSTLCLQKDIERGQNAQFASSDDIKILAHGLLQLGQGLKQHMDRTREEMKAVLEQLNAYNISIHNLRRVAKNDEKTLKETTMKLEIQNELHNRSVELGTELVKALQEQQLVISKVDSLERKLEKILGTDTEKNRPVNLLSCKSVAEVQNQLVNEVLVLIKAQQLQINEQNHQIQLLEDKVLNGGFESKEYYNFRERKGNNSANEQNGHMAVSPSSDCYQIFKRGERTSGVYRIQPEGSQSFQTYCQMTAEFGWTVIQQRFNGSVNFDHLWVDYKTGFGAPQGEFWLGLENFYQIAHQAQYVLRIELEDWKKKSRHIDYAFRLGNEDNSYSLQISQVLSGDLSSTMSACKAVPFSTSDRDSDLHSMINCAEQHSGGWWFSGCGESNLNGKYLRSRINRRPDRKKGIFWKSWKGNYYSFKSTRLMIRPLRITN